MQETVPKPKRMVRKQLLLTPEQNQRLASIAAATERPESEIVREAIETWLAKQAAGDEDWKAAWRQAAGMWKGRTDLDAFYAERRERRRQRRERMNQRMAEGRSK